MRSLKLIPALLIAFNLLVLGGPTRLGAQPDLCTPEVFTHLSQGYEALQAGKDEQARLAFEKALAIDPYNPFALNNLAVLAERQGKLKEALAYLLNAETCAPDYLHKADEICEGGGLCLAATPATQKSRTSSIASIIRSNIHLLRSKIKKAPQPE